MKKKLKIYITVINVFITLSIYAQTENSQFETHDTNPVCGETQSSTNPQSPSDSRNPGWNGQPFINEITPGIPKFNWLDEYWDWYKSVLPSTPQELNSPFFSGNTPNVKHFAQTINPALADNKVEDGWEMINVKLGRKWTYNSTTQEVNDYFIQQDHPLVLMYNRFRGVLRVFVYFSKTPTHLQYDAVYIRLFFDDDPNEKNGKNYPALFSHFEANARSLRGFDKDLENTVVNEKIAINTGEWIWADFALSYDPCVCYFQYQPFRIEVRAITEAHIELGGSINLSGYVDIEQKQGTAPSKSDWTQTIGKADKAGQVLYKSSSFLLSESSKKTYAGLFHDSKKKEAFEKVFDSKLLKGIPYVGYFIGVADFLVMGDQKPKFSGDITMEGDIKLTGSITNKSFVFENNQYIPGAIHAEAIGDNSTHADAVAVVENLPMYNEPLGVFTMMEAPLIKYVEYISPEFLESGLSGTGLSIRQYKVQELPKYRINPSSGMEIEEMKISLILDYAEQYEPNWGEFQTNQVNIPHFHPVLFDYPNTAYLHSRNILVTMNGNTSTIPVVPLEYQIPSYKAYEAVAGFNLEKVGGGLHTGTTMARLTLGQIPVGCFENTTFYLTHLHYFNERKLVLKIRFNLLLKEIVSGKLHKVIQTYMIGDNYIVPDENQTTPLLYEQAQVAIHIRESAVGLTSEIPVLQPFSIKPFNNSVYNNPNSPSANSPHSSYYQEKNTNILDILILDDLMPNFKRSRTKVDPGDYYAWEYIQVGGSSLEILPPANFFSGGDIRLDPMQTISPEVRFVSNKYPDESCYDSPMDFNIDDVSDFCTSPIKYRPKYVYSSPDLDIDTTPIVKTFDFKLYPNPTSRVVNVELPEMAEGGVYDITVMDIRGQVMSEMRILPSETIGSVYEMEVSHLTAGIYFVRLVIDGEAKVKRLVIL
jgi:hypothetical protein